MKIESTNLNLRDIESKGYGVTTGNILFTTTDNKHEPSKYQAVYKDGKLASIVTTDYVIVPNEEVLDIIKQAGFEGLKQNVHYTRNGYGMFVELLSKEKKEIRVGDTAQVGVMVRNSIDGTIGLGADGFTFRLVCSNGAVRRDTSLGSFYAKHVGDREKLIEGFKESIERTMLAAEELIGYYKKMVDIELNKQLAEQIVLKAKVPEKYLPEYIHVEKSKQFKTVEVTVTKQKDLFTVFNDLTDAVWHSEKLRIQAKSFLTNNIHKVMIPEVKARSI